jgi:hypothetical protein
MSNNRQTDADELGGFPSAASPLSAMGIDPDEARANPELMARLTRGPAPMPQKRAGAGAMLRQPDGSTTPSEIAAGLTGGSGDAASPGASGVPSVPATGAPTAPYGYGMEGLGASRGLYPRCGRATPTLTISAHRLLNGRI